MTTCVKRCGHIHHVSTFAASADPIVQAVEIAKTVNLTETDNARQYRGSWAGTRGAEPPSIILADTTTSNVFSSGSLLMDQVANYTTLITNGSAVYGVANQNDNGALEGFLRAAVVGCLDFGRIILLRAGSNYDRPSKNESILQGLLYRYQTNSLQTAVGNMVLVGDAIISDILDNWDACYASGVKASNYIGDIMGTLGGIPDFG